MNHCPLLANSLATNGNQNKKRQGILMNGVVEMFISCLRSASTPADFVMSQVET